MVLRTGNVLRSVSGQELEPARLPNTDFSCVEIDVAPNVPLRSFLVVRGSRFEPLEILPSSAWRGLDPQATSTRRGTLRAEIERLRALPGAR